MLRYIRGPLLVDQDFKKIQKRAILQTYNRKQSYPVMVNVEKHLYKVRYRNAGDDFHELWAARRILRLIDPRNDLVAVSIEGISEKEKSGTKAGLLVVDMVEYFGAEVFQAARQIVYIQLKHSTTKRSKPWSAGELGEVIEGFADRFKELVKLHGKGLVESKIRFQFVTNRPISPNVISAFMLAVNQKGGQLGGHISKTFHTIKEKYGIDDGNFTIFLSLLTLTGRERDRYGQEGALEEDAQRLIPDFDVNVRSRLKSLVHKMTLPEYRDDPTIRKDDLLAALDIVNEKQLFPAPPRFEFEGVSIPREQEADIVKKILESSGPVVIHASGGIGKSIVATRLPGLMPKGSACVVFDGFAGGEYTLERIPRHQHRYGLVQMANELAAKGLCEPLLPLQAQPAAYLQAFRVRLTQAAATIRSTIPNAVVFVVLDAADNSVMAAEESHDPAFVRGLIQEPPPNGCRMVFLSRTERLGMLAPPEGCCIIKLEPFSITESAKHLRQKFQDASDNVVQRFHQLTAGNPRVQAYELSRANSLLGLLDNLGPNVRDVDDVVAEQVHKALNHIRQNSPKQDDVDRLCLALAALPPMVPIRLLARAAGVQEEAVQSFVSDMGHPLLIRDDSVQFRDEPVETWFRVNFFREDADFSGLADALSPLAETDSYVAITLPRVMYHAKRYEALMSLALRDDGPSDGSVIERRDIVLRRVQYAMKAMLREKRLKDVMKLLLRAAEEVASKERQAEFLMKNGALVASLSKPGVLPDLVFRKHAGFWSGVRLAHRAAILAGHPQYKAEAYGFFRQAWVWLKEWSHLSDNERREQELSHTDIAAFVLSAFYLAGAKAALNELIGWRPKSLIFDVGRIVVRTLIDLIGKSSITDLVQVSQKQTLLLLAVAIELDEVGGFIPLREATQIANALLRREQEKTEKQERGFSLIQMATVCVAESLAFHGQAALGRDLIERHFPELPRYLSPALSGEADTRILTLRASTLRAVLRGEDLTVEGMLPESVKKEHVSKSNRRELEKFYTVLLPWFKMRVQTIIGELKGKELDEHLSSTAASRRDDYEERAYGLRDIDQIIARTWMSVLVIGGISSEDRVTDIKDWLASRRFYVYIPTWTYLARMAAHSGNALGAALELAAKAAQIVGAEHMSASTAAGCLADLAKAVLPVSREEARAFLDQGFKILDRLDDEARHRLELLFALAHKAGKECTAESKEAYRLGRVTELVHAYDDHKFPWYYASASIAELCPSSSLAIISRWRDRKQGLLEETLPAATKRLAEKGKIPSGVVVALNTLGRHWRFGEVLNTLLRNEQNHEQRQQILEIVERDLEIEGCGDYTAREIIDTLKSVGMTSHRISKMIVSSSGKIEQETNNVISHIGSKDREEIDWNTILRGSIFVTPQEVDHAARTLKKTSNYFPWKELFQKMRERVPVSRRSEHIIALASSSELSIQLIVDALKEVKGEWKRFSIVRETVPKITKSLMDRWGAWLISSPYLLNRDVSDLADLAEQSKQQILIKLLEAAINQIDDISAEGLQGIVGEYSEYLTPTECLDILRFALDRFEPLLKDTDGDGPWTPGKNPDCTLPEAVAGMLWSFLGAPETELRWKSAHAVRRLCKLTQKDVVEALIARFGDKQCTNFVDKRLPFYHMHSLLYALIALARAAQERPEVLLPYAQTFADYALQEPSHVLIHHFASQAALALEASHPGTFDSVTTQRLRQVNQSPHSKISREYRLTGSERRKNSRFTFPYGLEEGWFQSLARAFDGVSESEVAERSEGWIVDKWGVQDGWRWNNDPRANLGLYKERSTWSDKFSYPRVDTYGFYLSIHAMFCAAGELLNQKHVVVEDGRRDLWKDWLKGHILTRKDGAWLSDRRDPIPSECRSKQHETYDPDWRWLVNRNSFDDVLWPSTEDDRKMVIWGSWQVVHGYDRYEIVHISSALVSPGTSLALLRALQTCENPRDYRIPWTKDDMRILNGPFKMVGWIRWDDPEKGLDDLDPLSGDIPYRSFEPRPAVLRIMKLRKSSDDRTWRQEITDSVALQSQIWGTWERNDRSTRPTRGRRLIAKVDFVLEVLKSLNSDLIIEVQIERTADTREEIGYVPPYSRLFVLRSNGTLHVLEGCRRIRM